jgi:hypothetical protein
MFLLSSRVALTVVIDISKPKFVERRERLLKLLRLAVRRVIIQLRAERRQFGKGAWGGPCTAFHYYTDVITSTSCYTTTAMVVPGTTASRSTPYCSLVLLFVLLPWRSRCLCYRAGVIGELGMKSVVTDDVQIATGRLASLHLRGCHLKSEAFEAIGIGMAACMTLKELR